MNFALNLLGRLGSWVRDHVEGVGYSARTFFYMLGVSPGLLRRPRLLIEQLHFIGNYSMLIITLSGLFVGMVLGLQGYYTLNKYGAEQSLGLLVALGLTR
jgi:phospholipid/cholesterol/gamma-HCH transport system permease protein